MPVLVVRHAHALSRKRWHEADGLRPLSDRGRAQAAGLVTLVSPYRPSRVLSSPAVRCVETASPPAEALGLTVEHNNLLAEGAGGAGVRFILSLLEGDEVVVACTHGDVADDLLAALDAGGAELDGGYQCAKGSTWVLGRLPSGRVRGQYLPPPAVLARP